MSTKLLKKKKQFKRNSSLCNGIINSIRTSTLTLNQNLHIYKGLRKSYKFGKCSCRVFHVADEYNPEHDFRKTVPV